MFLWSLWSLFLCVYNSGSLGLEQESLALDDHCHHSRVFLGSFVWDPPGPQGIQKANKTPGQLLFLWRLRKWELEGVGGGS